MSSRTRGPTMTRAPAAFALAKASSTSPSPCPITRGFALAASAAARNPPARPRPRGGNVADASGSTSTMGPVLRADVRVGHGFGRLADSASHGSASGRRHRRPLRLPPEFAQRTMPAVPNAKAIAQTTSRAARPHARAFYLQAAGSDHTNEVEFRMDEGGDAASADDATPHAFSRRRQHYMWLPHRSEICAT